MNFLGTLIWLLESQYGVLRRFSISYTAILDNAPEPGRYTNCYRRMDEHEYRNISIVLVD